MSASSKQFKTSADSVRPMKIKNILSSLEKIKGNGTAEKDQLRYLSHKLLKLVIDQDTPIKDATTKAALETIMNCLENCTDQASCLALVSTISEISKDGGLAVKRLISHDATRVLLHILAFRGQELSCRVLSAIVNLLSRLGVKDRRFAVRARITGALSVILTTVRSSYSHHGHSNLLSSALNLLKLSLLNSSTNATILGRAGGVNVIYRVILSLNRRQQTSLRSALASFNLLVRLSKVNASRAVGLGAVSLMLTMHQDYHKHDFRHDRNIVTRKSILNVLKNVALLKSGRRAFSEADGMRILHATCLEYLQYSGSSAKSAHQLLSAGTLIVVRCQQKHRLPVAAHFCSFRFPLPGRRASCDEFANSQDGFIINSDDDDDEFDENASVSDAELERGEESETNISLGDFNNRRKSATSDNGSSKESTERVTRTYDDLKMYEKFFLELTDLPAENVQRKMSAQWNGQAPAPLTATSVYSSLPDMSHIDNPAPGRPTTNGDLPTIRMQHARTSNTAPTSTNGFGSTAYAWEAHHAIAQISDGLTSLLGSSGFEPSTRQKRCSSSRSRERERRSRVSSDGADSAGSSSTKVARDDLSDTSSNQGYNPRAYTQWSPRFRSIKTSTTELINLPRIGSSTAPARSPSPSRSNSKTRLTTLTSHWTEEVDEAQRVHRDKIRLIAEQTRSVKLPGGNVLSRADELTCEPYYARSEYQISTKSTQKLIKSKILDDAARAMRTDTTINQLVYDNDQRAAPPHDQPAAVDHVLIHDGDHDVRRATVVEALMIPTGRCSLVADDVAADLVDAGDERGGGWKHVSTSALPREHTDASTETTTVSDETWPGLRGDENGGKVAAAVDEDKTRAGESKKPSPPLKFDSNFESGNLRAAYRVRENEYDLVLNSDCNSNHHFQWFYFEVSGMRSGKPYRFNIVNCEKKGSNFNEGMQPVMFSMTEARQGRPFWRRVGRECCYYRNNYLRHNPEASGGRCYFTATFTVNFTHDRDVCYFAYHYPYTYSKLQMDLETMLAECDATSMFVQNQTLCYTLGGNPVPVLTITAPPRFDESNSVQGALEEMRSRPYIFLSARVHPGESNASWTMRGTLKLLLTPPPVSCDLTDDQMAIAAIADELRRSYIFKIVPMLNPDGVINGHHRCSLSGEDLNRTWLDPNPQLNPTIYHCKGLLQYMQVIQKAPLVYCDYHGHSRKMNVFLYGCSQKESIADGEAAAVADAPEDAGYKTLPKLLQHLAPPFALKDCSFVVEKSKLATARVVVWKEIGVARSYTMESSYCGCDQGELRGKQLGVGHLEHMGNKFCQTLLLLKAKNRQRGLPVFDSDDDSLLSRRARGAKQRRDDDGDDASTSSSSSPGCPANSDAELELTPDEDSADISPPPAGCDVDDPVLFWRYPPLKMLDRPHQQAHLRKSDSFSRSLLERDERRAGNASPSPPQHRAEYRLPRVSPVLPSRNKQSSSRVDLGATKSFPRPFESSCRKPPWSAEK